MEHRTCALSNYSSPFDAFQEVKARLTGEHVLDYFLPPAKHRRYLCPFHPDRNPSLTVKNGGIVCWACAWRGDIIRFVEESQGLSRQNALALLMDMAGILPTHEHTPRLSRLQILHRKIQQENDRIGREIERDTHKALASGWVRIFKKRYGDEEQTWEQISAVCTLERTVMNQGVDNE